MKEITTTNRQVAKARNEEILQSLDLSKQEFIRAALAPRICNMTPLSCSDEIISFIVEAHNNSGQVIDENTVLVQANETYATLMNLFPDVTIEEIRQAIRNGVYDQYGKYFGLNPKSYVGFVREYLKSEARKEAKERYEAEKVKASEPPPKMTVEQTVEAIENDYRIFLAHGKELIGFATFKYFFLIRDNSIKHVSGERWKMWLAQSKEELYWRKTEQAKKKGDKSTLNEIMKITASLEETGALPITEYKKIIFNARRLRYIAFFEYKQKHGHKTIF